MSLYTSVHFFIGFFSKTLFVCWQTPRCTVAMHTECAGLAEVPEGDWFCPDHAGKAKKPQGRSKGDSKFYSSPFVHLTNAAFIG